METIGQIGMAVASRVSRRIWLRRIALALALIVAFAVMIFLQWRSGYSYCIHCARITTIESLELRWPERPGSRIALWRRQHTEPDNALNLYLDPARQCVHEWRPKGSRLLGFAGRVDGKMYCPVCLPDISRPDFVEFLNAHDTERHGFRDELQRRIKDESAGEWLMGLYTVREEGNRPPSTTNPED